jgi:hypothetical protein
MSMPVPQRRHALSGDLSLVIYLVRGAYALTEAMSRGKAEIGNQVSNFRFFRAIHPTSQTKKLESTTDYQVSTGNEVISWTVGQLDSWTALP